MSRINEKMGLKPAGKRLRTHASQHLSAEKCEKCGRDWIVAFGREKTGRICGFCGHVQTMKKEGP